MKRLLPVLIALPFAQAVNADNEGYGGIGIGYTSFEVKDLDFEGSSTSTRVFLGVRLGSWLGLEGGFHRFGTATDQVAVEAGEPSVRVGIRTIGYEAAVLGIYPVNRDLSLFAKVGVINWDTDLRAAGEVIQDEDGNDLIWSVGTTYRGTGPFHVRIEGEFLDIDFADSWWTLSASIIYAIPFGR